jgi:hypothetical protein
VSCRWTGPGSSSTASPVATAVATAFAVWLAFVQRRERKQAEAERDDLRQDQKRAQAQRIVGWLEEESTEPSAYEVVFPDPLPRTVIVVMNGSDLPALLVSPQAYSPDAYTSIVGEFIPVLAPGQTVRRPLDGVVPQFNERPYAQLDFRDAAGRRWRRDERGGLILISEDEPAPTLRATPPD